MIKTTRSNQNRKNKKNLLKSYRPFTNPELKNSKLVSETLLDCIRTEDLISFRDVLTSCLISINKTHLAKKAGIGRQTLYDLINPERGFNPELSTIAAIIRALAHEGEHPDVA